MHGLDVLRAVRELPVDPLPVMIVMTTSTVQADRDRAHELGCTEFHVKPMGFPDFIVLMEGILDRWLAKTGAPTAMN